jgi:hypothetical protein
MTLLRVASVGTALILAQFAGCVSAWAQQDPDPVPALDQLAPDSSSSDPSVESTYAPLTLKQKWLFSVEETFGPQRIAGYAMHTIFDYAFDLPKQWGREGDSLAVRMASDFGDSLIRHDLQFAIQALDHEDPRYFRSNLHGGFKRTKYAILHTLVVRNDNGSWMPAYSLLVTDYGMPFLVRQWRPDRMHALTGFEAGTMGLGISMGSNVFFEFLPDLKKKLPKTFRFIHR